MCSQRVQFLDMFSVCNLLLNVFLICTPMRLLQSFPDMFRLCNMEALNSELL